MVISNKKIYLKSSLLICKLRFFVYFLFDLAAPTGGLLIANAIKDAGLVESALEAIRIIEHSAASIDKVKITNKKMLLLSGNTHIAQVRKRRFAKINTC